MTNRLLGAAAAIAMLAAPALAATDGTLGPTSTGTFDVSVEFQGGSQQQIIITNLVDVDMGFVQKNTGDFSSAINYACVHIPGGGLYDINVSLTPLSNGLGDEHTNYSGVMDWFETGNASGASGEVFPGSPLSLTGLTASTLADCSDFTDFGYRTFVDTNTITVPNGIYTATMQFVVTPQ